MQGKPAQKLDLLRRRHALSPCGRAHGRGSTNTTTTTTTHTHLPYRMLTLLLAWMTTAWDRAAVMVMALPLRLAFK